MNLGDFLCRPQPRAADSPGEHVDELICTECLDARIVNRYPGGTSLLVMALDAQAHVHARHPAAEWRP